MLQPILGMASFSPRAEARSVPRIAFSPALFLVGVLWRIAHSRSRYAVLIGDHLRGSAQGQGPLVAGENGVDRRTGGCPLKTTATYSPSGALSSNLSEGMGFPTHPRHYEFCRNVSGLEAASVLVHWR